MPEREIYFGPVRVLGYIYIATRIPLRTNAPEGVEELLPVIQAARLYACQWVCAFGLASSEDLLLRTQNSYEFICPRAGTVTRAGCAWVGSEA